MCRGFWGRRGSIGGLAGGVGGGDGGRSGGKVALD